MNKDVQKFDQLSAESPSENANLRFELESLMDRINSMEYGKEKVAAAQKCVEMADRLGATEQRLWARWELIWAYEFGDDPAKRLPICAEFMAIYQENPRAFPKVAVVHIAQMAFNSATAVSQVPKEQCDKLLDEVLALVKSCGKGMQMLASYATQYAIEIGNRKMAEEYLHQTIHLRRDILSECEACDKARQARLLLMLDHCDEALAAMEKLLAQGLSCREEPWLTLSAFVEKLLAMGQVQQARRFAKKIFAHGISQPHDLPVAGALLMMEGALREHRWADVSLLERCWGWTLKLWDQDLQFDFYLGAWCYCKRLAQEQATVKLVLPKPLMPTQEKALYECEQLADWIWNEAQRIATAFDTRNASDYYAKRLKDTAHIWNAACEGALT